ncbi:MAG: hypothetical protein M3Q64_03610 [bacterium]|nr:hypothetical protein [bacterium]
MNYEKFKIIFDGTKPGIIVFGCLVISFITGYFIGTGDREPSIPTKRQLNYNTTTDKPQGNKNSNATPKPIMNKNTSTTQDGSCTIKGNVASGGKKTYHVPGGSFYDRTTAELCFQTENEAVAAGFVKSSR